MDDLIYWLQATTRWVHVLAAILWIGQTYLFNFFERNLEPSLSGASSSQSAGNLWMVHGGGFYLVKKWREPEIRPQKLHWFKWEAATTWLSGVLLIYLTYYRGGLLVEPGMDYRWAAGCGIGVIVFGWVLYDWMVRSPLARSELLFTAVSFALLLAVCYALDQVMSERSAFIHVGALLGTIMTANVWMRILPAQRKLIALADSDEPIDSRLTATGPQRSKHNTYMAHPLLFLMISNHYPTTTYGHTYNWAILGAILLVGWVAARVLRG